MPAMWEQFLTVANRPLREVPVNARAIATEAKLLLIGIPVLLWTILPVYHMVLFAISPRDSAFAGNLWPDHPTLNNFVVVLQQKHHMLLLL